MQEREAIIFGDTYAQWAMTFFNLIALGLSGWAIWLLKETLAATRVAVREAEKATAAALRGEEAAVGGVAEARHANDIARTANALSQRPWLSLVGPEPLGIRIMSTELGSPTKSVFFDFDVSITNTGEIPALNVQMHTVAGDRSSPEWEVAARRMKQDALAPSGSALSVGPGETQLVKLTKRIHLLPEDPARPLQSSIVWVQFRLGYSAVNTPERMTTIALFLLSREEAHQRTRQSTFTVQRYQLDTDNGQPSIIGPEGTTFVRMEGVMT